MNSVIIGVYLSALNFVFTKSHFYGITIPVVANMSMQIAEVYLSFSNKSQNI